MNYLVPTSVVASGSSCIQPLPQLLSCLNPFSCYPSSANCQVPTDQCYSEKENDWCEYFIIYVHILLTDKVEM